MPYITNQYYINSLLDSSWQPHWNGTGTFAQAASVSYSFARFVVPGGEGAQAIFNAEQEVAARTALQAWANVANITFNEVVDTGVFTGDSVSRGDINFVNEDIS